MARGAGLALKGVSLFLRFIELCCAAIILGIFSYFLATLRDHNLHIATYIRAVEGISGAGVLYTLIAVLLVCFLGGIAFFSLVGILLDLAFCGAFIYVAWALRGGAHSCKGNVNTPLGSGNTATSNTVTGASGGIIHLPSLKTACKLETAAFAVAIIAAFFFLLSILAELGLMKHHRKERAFGPSPNNGYTAGSPKRKFWQRKSKHDNAYAEKGNPDALPHHTSPNAVRDSYATESTAVGNEPVINKYGNSTAQGNATVGHNNHHLGRDAAMVGGAGGLADHEYRKHEATPNTTHQTGNAYSTTTTTHVPHHNQATGGTYQAYNPTNTVPNNNGTF